MKIYQTCFIEIFFILGVNIFLYKAYELIERHRRCIFPLLFFNWQHLYHSLSFLNLLYNRECFLSIYVRMLSLYNYIIIHYMDILCSTSSTIDGHLVCSHFFAILTLLHYASLSIRHFAYVQAFLDWFLEVEFSDCPT